MKAGETAATNGITNAAIRITVQSKAVHAHAVYKIVFVGKYLSPAVFFITERLSLNGGHYFFYGGAETCAVYGKLFIRLRSRLIAGRKNSVFVYRIHPLG